MKIISLILILVFFSSADTTSFRNRVIDSIMKWEGGAHTFGGVRYNYGLSGTYHGNVTILTRAEAKQKFRELWQESNTGKIPDTNWQLLYFDTYVLFNPTTAKSLMVSCYNYDEFLMRRVQEHVDKAADCPKCRKEERAIRKARREMMYGYMLRVSRLRDMLAQ